MENRSTVNISLSQTGYYILGVLFFVSGFCSLSYQMVWVKLFSLQFGGTAWSISTVVSAFMAGLALGSFIAGRYTPKIRRPLLSYALLELGIIVFGLFSLVIFNYLDVGISLFYSFLENNFVGFIILRFLFSFAILLIPTTLMGASLPILISATATSTNIYRETGRLYAINTLGAALGIAVTSFIWLPQMGLTLTIVATSVIGGIVVAATIYLEKKHIETTSETPCQSQAKIPVLLLLLLFLAGTISLFMEVAWTRLLIPVLGSSTYAFSIILLTFLISIATGSYLVTRFPRLVTNYLSNIAILLVLAMLSMVLGLFFINYLPAFFHYLASLCSNMWLFFAVQITVTSALVLVPTSLIAAILPLAIAGYYQETQDSGKSVGIAYAVNTFGGIIGSLAAGFICLPYWGMKDSIAGIIILGSFACIVVLAINKTLAISKKLIWVAIAFTPITIWIAPQVDMYTWHSGIFRRVLNKKSWDVPKDYRLIYAKDGINATVTVYRNINSTSLKINGKTDASSLEDLSTQYLLGHFPMFLAKSPEKVFVLGLGSGATAYAVATHPVKSIDIVELEDSVVEASQYFEGVNQRILQDSRVNLYVEDGRSFLKYRNRTYDVIISEPSNPWIEGSSALFSQEFYQIAKKRLTPEGVFCQWIQSYEISETTLKTMLQTLHKVFPHVVIFQINADYICVASESAIQADANTYPELFQREELQKTLQRIAIRNPYELFFRYVGSLPQDNETWNSHIINTDNNMWLEYRAPLEMYYGVRPQMPQLPFPEYLKRMKLHFFSQHSKNNFLISMAETIKTLEPNNWKDIEIIASQLDNPGHVIAITEIAKMRSNLISNKQNMLDEVNELIQQQKYPLAIQRLENMVSIFPYEASLFRLLAKAYTRKGDTENALKAYEHTVWLTPEDYVSQANVGILLYQLNNKEKSQEFIENSLRYNPKYNDARVIWIGLLARDQEKQKIREVYQQALKALTPDEMLDLRSKLNEIGIDIDSYR